jgi:hypothetical protein
MPVHDISFVILNNKIAWNKTGGFELISSIIPPHLQYRRGGRGCSDGIKFGNWVLILATGKRIICGQYQDRFKVELLVR